MQIWIKDQITLFIDTFIKTIIIGSGILFGIYVLRYIGIM